jgi:6-hydroxy-3-succinoylpyridine 3-monooxygenase
VEGAFKKKRIECKHMRCPAANRRFFRTLEEKRTDVNIVIQMLDDAYQGGVDRMVLVSGDSDLVPVIVLLGKRFPKVKISVYIPASTEAPVRSLKGELHSVAHDVRALPVQLLGISQFPSPVPLPDGTKATKPIAWINPQKTPPIQRREASPGCCDWCHMRLAQGSETTTML